VPFRENNLTAFIEQLFLIQAIGPTGNMLTFNFPAWSISVEFYTYVLFGITSLVAQRKAIVVFAGFSAVSFVFLSLDILPGFHELLRCTSGFFLGCVTAAIVAAARFTVPPLATTTTLFILFTFLQWKPFLQFDEAISLLTSVLIACVVRSDRGMARAFLGSPFLVWLGTISYSVYMANGAIVWTISQVLRLVLKRPELVVEGRLTPQLSIPETLLTYAIAIPIILAVAQITYWLIEKPLRERSRAFAAAHFGGVPPLKDHR
jgi:peptidoglycan/LPS O-acetylase OafA/YrhL